jgi:hypothetical protein
MKLNWGTGIAIFYSTFVLIFIGIVIKSTQYDVNMVKKDYYADDLNYQSHFDKKQNARFLTEGVGIRYDNERSAVILRFPTNMPLPEGTVTLFHPARDKDDKFFTIKTDNAAAMEIPVKGLPNGRWRLQIDWKSGNKAFYKEEYIIIQNKV